MIFNRYDIKISIEASIINYLSLKKVVLDSSIARLEDWI